MQDGFISMGCGLRGSSHWAAVSEDDDVNPRKHAFLGKSLERTLSGTDMHVVAIPRHGDQLLLVFFVSWVRAGCQAEAGSVDDIEVF